MPAPDDIEGWKALQAANDDVKEAKADEKAAAFGVTYEETEVAGIPVVEVKPSELASTDKIAVYTHGGAYVLNSAKAVIESAMFFAAETGLRVIAVDYTLAGRIQSGGRRPTRSSPYSRRWPSRATQLTAVNLEDGKIFFRGGRLSNGSLGSTPDIAAAMRHNLSLCLLLTTKQPDKILANQARFE